MFGGAIRDRALAARGLGRGCGLPAPQRSALTAPWQLPGSICSSSRSCSVHSQDCVSSKKLLSLLGAVQLLQTCEPTLGPLLCTCVAHVATSALNACVADGVRGHSAPFPAHTWEVCEDHGSSHIHIGNRFEGCARGPLCSSGQGGANGVCRDAVGRDAPVPTRDLGTAQAGWRLRLGWDQQTFPALDGVGRVQGRMRRVWSSEGVQRRN